MKETYLHIYFVGCRVFSEILLPPLVIDKTAPFSLFRLYDSTSKLIVPARVGSLELNGRNISTICERNFFWLMRTVELITSTYEANFSIFLGTENRNSWNKSKKIDTTHIESVETKYFKV